MKRRIIHKLKITEISGVDRPCVEHAKVTIMKRAPFEESKHPRADDGKWTSGSGGGGSESVGGAASPEHKQSTLRWAQVALRVAKIASWGITIAAASAAFTASLPVAGAGFAIGAALATLVSRSSLTRAAAFLALDSILSELIEYREAELNKADPRSDPVLATLKAMRAELQTLKPKGEENNTMNEQDDDLQQQLDARVGELRKQGLSGCDALRKCRTESPETFADFQRGPNNNGAFEQLVAEEIRKGAPASVAGQRVINRYGPRPDAARIAKSEGAVCDFMAAVDAVMIEKNLSRTAAMTEVRRANPAAFAKFQEV